MPTTEELFDYARLADAAYIDLSKVLYWDPAAVAAAAVSQERLPLKLAEDTFTLSGWQVVAYDDLDNKTTGFASTLFKGPGEEYVLGIRGTESGLGSWEDLFKADLKEIGFLGLALSQAVSMVNFVLRLTSSGTNILQLDLKYSTADTPPAASNHIGTKNAWLWLEPRATGATGLNAIPANTQIDVTGHSLGGHLAGLATRLFPNLFDQAVLFNAPGFDPPTATWVKTALNVTPLGAIFSQQVLPPVQALTDEAMDMFRAWIPSVGTSFGNIASFVSEDIAKDNDADVISGLFTGPRFGPDSTIAVEMNSHGMGQIVDSLALQQLLARVDSLLQIPQIAQLTSEGVFRDGSPSDNAALERILVALERQLLQPDAPNNLPIVEAGGLFNISSGDFANRTAWYNRWRPLQDALNGTSLPYLVPLQGQLETWSITASSDMGSAAKEDFSDFIALKTLSPFSLRPEPTAAAAAALETVWTTIHNADYAAWTADKDAGTHANFSPEWYTDRADMLRWMLVANDRNIDYPSNNNRITGQPIGVPIRYDDKALNTTFTVSVQPLSDSALGVRRVIFGVDGNTSLQTLTGADANDRIYGGNRADALIGNAGRDYLEGRTGIDDLQGGSGNDKLIGGADSDLMKGGADDDVLNGGQGNDSYFLYTSESGVDTILDSDNKGRLHVDGIEILGFNAITSGLYESTGGALFRLAVTDAGNGKKNATLFRKSDGRLLANIVGVAGPSVLGYTLQAPTPASYDVQFIRTNEPDRIRIWWLQDYRDPLYTYKVIVPPPDSRSAFVDAGSSNDYVTAGTFLRTEIRGGAGSDFLHAFRQSDAVVNSMTVTTLVGGDGSDMLEGGVGTLTMDAGNGNDYVSNARHRSPYFFIAGLDAQGGLHRFAGGQDGYPQLIPDAGSAIEMRPIQFQGMSQGYDPAYSKTFFYKSFFKPGTYTSAGLNHGDGSPNYYVSAFWGSGDVFYSFTGTTNATDPNRVVNYTFFEDPSDPRNTRMDVKLLSGRVVHGVIFWNYGYQGTAAEIDAQMADAKLDGTGNENGFAYVSLGAGSDIFEGGAGKDVVDGGIDNDFMDGAGGEDILDGGAGDDVIAGGRYTDVLYGGADNDKLFGGGEADRLYGGDGNDLMYGEYDFGSGEPGGDDWLDGGDGWDQLVGGEGADTLLGGSGNDILMSEGKDAELDGGDGDDLYVIRDNLTTQCEFIGNLELDSTNVIELNGNGRDALVTNFFRADLPENVEDLTLESLGIQGGTITGSDWDRWGGDTRAKYTGNSADNTIDAVSVGNNSFVEFFLDGVVIDGAGGADRMKGGRANETYVVDNAGDIVDETGGSFSTKDRVKSTVSWTLGSNLEDLELVGTDPVQGSGNALDNILQSFENSAANDLQGGLGNDTYIIGLNDVVRENPSSGNDTVVIADTLGATGVTVRVSDYANVENLHARTGGVTTVLGDAGANVLIGSNGLVDGGAGDDIISDLDFSVYNTRGVKLGFDLLELPMARATLLGGLGNDTLTSVSGFSVLDGGAGNDVMGAGSYAVNTTYVFGVGYGADRINDSSGVRQTSQDPAEVTLDKIQVTTATDARQLRFARTGNDLVVSIFGTTDTLTVTGFWNTDGTVRSTVDTIELPGGGLLTRESILTGLLGSSRVTATAGDDLLIGSAAASTLAGGNGRDHLIGAGQADTLRGDAGNDYLSGGAGNDTLDGGTGDDILRGGQGDDIYIVDSAGDRIVGEEDSIIDPQAGIDTVRASASYQISMPIENLELTGTANIDATGNGYANRLRGNSGANRLDGFWGADDMAGGAGNDTYVVDNFGDLVTELANEGTDTVEVSETYFTNSNFYALGSNVENLILTSNNGVNGLGNALANNLRGNAGDNRLEGYAGLDVFEGGEGNDTLVSLGQGSRFVFNRGDGHDVIINQTSATLALGTLELGAGIASSDLLFQRGGTDPGVGADDLVIQIANSSDSIVVKNHFTSQSGVRTGGLSTLSIFGGGLLTRADLDALAVTSAIGGGGSPGSPPSIQNVITGTAGADSLSGTTSNDYFDALDGDDFVSGQSGDDSIYGGNGNDSLNGEDGRDWINGGAGNDFLRGGSGFNTVYGGAGDDWYFVDSITDYLFESVNEGSDGVQATVSWALAPNFERLSFTGSAPLQGIGNDLNNSISGNAGGNNLSGGAGDDYIAGGGGNDTILGGTGSDSLRGEAGNDTIDSGSRGASLPDLLDGGTGDDLLISDGSGANFAFLRGDGIDIIDNHAATGAASGLISFYSSGINPSDVLLWRGTGANVNDLIISLKTTLQTITVRNHFLTTAGNRADGLSGISFSDNTFWMRSTIDANTISNGPVPTEGNDTLEGTNGNDSINALGGDDTVYGYDGDDGLQGGSGNDTLYGDAGNDALDGGAGNDTLFSGGGNNILSGGPGNDTYWVNSTADLVIEAAAEGTDIVKSAVTYMLSANVENLLLTGTSSINGTGNTLSNALTGNSGANRLDGSIGGDTMAGGAGDDVYVVDDTADIITEGASAGNDHIEASVSYTLSANVESLTLTGAAAINATGNSLNNALTGNVGANRLDGGAGADTMVGEAGDDLYVVDSSSDIVTELASQGTDTVQSSIAYTLGANVENLELTGTAAINGNGNTLNNALFGNNAANRLDGGAGVDAMTGGGGNDTYVVDNAGDLVVEAAGGGIDTVEASITHTLGLEVENLVLTGTSAIDGTGNILANVLTGNTAVNVLIGGAGDDTINGISGADTLDGGLGNDVLNSDGSGATFSMLRSDEVDVINNHAASGAASGVLSFLGTGIRSGDVQLTRGAGVDSDDLIVSVGIGGQAIIVRRHFLLTGANRSDGVSTIRFDDGTSWSRSTIDANTLSPNVPTEGNDVLNGSVGNDSINALGGDDIVYGDAGNDVLQGGTGNDRLDGGAGSDSLVGGAGNDTYVVDNVADVVTEAAAGGTDTVESSITYTLGTEVENLTLTGTGAINATGNTLANTLRGNAAANVLSGGTGADTLIGGAGNDSYTVDNVGDVTTELANEGTDLVNSSITWTLSANVENLTLTGTGAINATGNTLANSLTGNSGANRLDGGVGVDTLAGAAGNDIYVVDNAGDLVVEAASGGTDTVESSVSYTLGTEVENLTLTGATAINGTGNTLNNTLTGNAAANLLTGGAGNDTLSGGAGIDTLVGGAGNDTYAVDVVGDVVTELLNEGTDTVQTALTYTLGANVENLTLTGAATVNGSGNDLANTLTGNSAANVLTGGLGNDTLNGGAGVDTLVGGAGNDIYVVDVLGDVVTELANEGTDTIQTALTYTLGATLENLTLTGSAAVNGTGNTANNTITGNTANNVLTGGAGNDTLNGGAGVDTLVGGVGNDTYVVDVAGDLVTELAGEGTDTVQSAITYVLGATLENLTLTGAATINGTGNTVDNLLTGNSAVNTLTGGAGNDTLNGAAGADTLVGGTGNDSYTVDNVGDVTTELANEGTDLVNSSITWTLAANVENLTLTGATAINGTGNTLDNLLTGNSAANVLTGGAGNDTLNGAAGADTLVGGIGNDSYTVDNAGDVTTELAGEGTDLVNSSITWTLAANLENLTLTGATAINGTGNTLDNLIIGNSAANVLSGGAGNDTLNGGAGADNLIGGSGNDTYVVDNASDITTELASEGTDTVQSSITWTLAANVENLTLTGAAVINGTGNTLNNTLVGNAAANVLNGSTGNDAMTGGAGNDTYVVDSTADATTELAGEGTDLVQSMVSWTLAANIENLTLTGTAAINGTGNTLDNVITGNSANNVLSGAAGNDTLTDSAGANVYIGGAGNDTLNVTSTGIDRIALARGHGIDTVVGSGSAANDVLEVSNGITKTAMGLIKSGNDLLLDLGSGESVTLRNWYAGVRNVGTLKIIGDAAWVPGQTGTPTLVETLSLATLAAQFDAARAADPLLTRWSLSSASIALVSRTAAFSDEGSTTTLATSAPRRTATVLAPKSASLRSPLEPSDAVIAARGSLRNLRALLDVWAPTTEAASKNDGWLKAAAEATGLSAETLSTVFDANEAPNEWLQDANPATPRSNLRTLPPRRTTAWWEDTAIAQSLTPLIKHAAVVTGWEAVNALSKASGDTTSVVATSSHAPADFVSLSSISALNPAAHELGSPSTWLRVSANPDRRTEIR